MAPKRKASVGKQLAKALKSKTVRERLRELALSAKTPAKDDETVLLRLSIPPSECSPNARCHWAKTAAARKRMRDEAAKVAEQSRLTFSRPLISAIFYHATRRDRDRDNAIASLKGAIDGLADGGLFANDKLVQWDRVDFHVDKDDPRVLIEIRQDD